MSTADPNTFHLVRESLNLDTHTVTGGPLCTTNTPITRHTVTYPQAEQGRTPCPTCVGIRFIERNDTSADLYNVTHETMPLVVPSLLNEVDEVLGVHA